MTDGLIVKAFDIATAAHAGQFRKDGKTSYIFHPIGVMDKVKSDTPVVQAVALLHDVLEDNADWTKERLLEQGIPQEVIDILLLLKHPHGEPYKDYLARVATNAIATKVKLADMIHNLSDGPTKRQMYKYANGIAFLLRTNHSEKTYELD